MKPLPPLGGESEYESSIVDSTTWSVNPNENHDKFYIRDGWYDDSTFSPPRLVLHDEPFDKNRIRLIVLVKKMKIEWEILKDGQRIHTRTIW